MAPAAATSLRSTKCAGTGRTTTATESRKRLAWAIERARRHVLVEVVPPSTYVVTTPDAGANDALDSEFDPDTNSAPPFAFTPDGSNLTLDCGFYQP